MSDTTTVIPARDAIREARRTRGRRPKAIDTRRTCAESGCVTVLSRYNRGDRCYAHREPRFPRIRASHSPSDV